MLTNVMRHGAIRYLKYTHRNAAEKGEICKQILFILKIRTAQRSSYSSTSCRKLGRGALNIISDLR